LDEKVVVSILEITTQHGAMAGKTQEVEVNEIFNTEVDLNSEAHSILPILCNRKSQFKCLDNTDR
jgi:hypothetical protein